MNISVIIPTYNEEQNLEGLFISLLEGGIKTDQIIVADGGSKDATLEIAKKYSIQIVICNKGRACQMNKAAQLVTGDWLYFVHADTIPPKGFLRCINRSITDGYDSGCFRSSFDSNSPLLQVNAFFTRFNKLWCRGGDQTLYVQKQLFSKLGGFSEAHVIMEDYDLIERLQEKGRFNIMPGSALISARKYEHNSYWRVMYANYTAFSMYKKGRATEKIKERYHQLLNLG